MCSWWQPEKLDNDQNDCNNEEAYDDRCESYQHWKNTRYSISGRSTRKKSTECIRITVSIYTVIGIKLLLSLSEWPRTIIVFYKMCLKITNLNELIYMFKFYNKNDPCSKRKYYTRKLMRCGIIMRVILILSSRRLVECLAFKFCVERTNRLTFAETEQENVFIEHRLAACGIPLLTC